MSPLVAVRRFTLLCALVAALAFTAAADAAVSSHLRVEGPGQTLDPGHTYKTGTAEIRKASQSGCKPKRRKVSIQGPTALGILASAGSSDRSLADDLRPLRVQAFPGTPGFFICRIGAFASDPGFWLYKVNHVSPEIGADQFRLRRNDEVLWYYANFNDGTNTGDELSLRAPARVEDGDPFSVRVLAFDGGGGKKPVEGATVTGGDESVLTGPDGRAELTASEAGRVRLAATQGSDIPSNQVKIRVE